MKILIINDGLLIGGAEIYALNLKKMLEQDYDVSMLTFDEDFDEKIEKVENKENIININPKSIIGKVNKLVFNPVLYSKIRKVLKQIKPDIIILNNIFASPITQMKALKGYKVCQVVHDYSVVCPKSTCIKEDSSVCDGYKYANCAKECKYHSSKLSVILKRYSTKKMEKLRKKFVKKLISPSQRLNGYLQKYNYNSICINNPVNIVEVNQEQKDHNRFVYIGVINENKGIFKFLDAFIEFSKGKDTYIDIIGKPASEEDEKRIKEIANANNNVNLLGYIPNNEILQNISRAKFMVVPSLWMENYPTTVLEGMLAGTVILGSNRGGIPEMLEDKKGIVFDIFNQVDIIEKLEMAYKLSENDYNAITNKSSEFVKTNNLFSKYKETFVKQVIEE